jgi:hypothetical protein
MSPRSWRNACTSSYSTSCLGLRTGVFVLVNTNSQSMQHTLDSNFGKNLSFISKFMVFGTKLEQLKLFQISQYIARNFQGNFPIILDIFSSQQSKSVFMKMLKILFHGPACQPPSLSPFHARAHLSASTCAAPCFGCRLPHALLCHCCRSNLQARARSMPGSRQLSPCPSYSYKQRLPPFLFRSP